MKRLGWLFALFVFIVITDQISKSYIVANFYLGESISVIDGLFSITHVQNAGAAWGMGSSFGGIIWVLMMLVLPVIACIWLLYLVWTHRVKSLRLSFAFTLIFSGAVGNLIDRFSLHYVIDFLDFYWNYSHFPAFNVADSCISVAACIWILDSIIQKWNEKLHAT